MHYICVVHGGTKRQYWQIFLLTVWYYSVFKHLEIQQQVCILFCTLQMFHRCQRAVTSLQTRCGHCTEQEERLLRNVVSSLAQSLQDLSINFRHTQSSYLKRKKRSLINHSQVPLFHICQVAQNDLFFFSLPGMKNREERSKHFFDSGPLMEEDEELAIYDKVLSVLLCLPSKSFGKLLSFADRQKHQHIIRCVEQAVILQSSILWQCFALLSFFCFRGSQMTSWCWWSRTQSWLRRGKERSGK